MTLPIEVTRESELIAESPLLLNQLALFPFYIALRYFIVNDDTIYYTLLGRHEYDEILTGCYVSPSFHWNTQGHLSSIYVMIGLGADETSVDEAVEGYKRLWLDRINDIIESVGK